MALKLTILHKEEEHSTEAIDDFGYGVSRALSFAAMGKDWSALVWEDTDKMAAGINPRPFRGGVILYNTFWSPENGGRGVDYRTAYVRLLARIMPKLRTIAAAKEMAYNETGIGVFPAESAEPTDEAKLALEVIEELKRYIG